MTAFAAGAVLDAFRGAAEAAAVSKTGSTALTAVALTTFVVFVPVATSTNAPTLEGISSGSGLADALLVAAGFDAAGLVPAGRVEADRVADRAAGFVATGASVFAGATFTAAAVLLARGAFTGSGCSGAGPTAGFARLVRLAGATATAGDTGCAADACTGVLVSLALVVLVVLAVAELDAAGLEATGLDAAFARLALAGFAASDCSGAVALSFDDVFASGFAVAALVTALDLGPVDLFGAVPTPSPFETAVTGTPAFSLVVALCAGMAWFVAFGIDLARSAMASPQTKRARGWRPRTAR